jgi:hypothetical protein
MAGVRRTTVPAAATWGLFVAWCLHDAEEWRTLAGFTERERARLEATLPWVPTGFWDRLNVSQRHVDVAIGLVGLVVLTAAADGARTGGRSGLYQRVLAAFGWHAVGHVAQSVVTRGYTPGVATSPLIVAPFALWATRRLRAAGVDRTNAGSPLSLLLLPPVLAAAHGLASVISRRADQRKRP